MHENNFQTMANLGSNNGICELGCFLQDLENQIWDGHPYIGPNLRVFFENWCDYIIKVGLKLKIKEDDSGDSREKIVLYFGRLEKDKKFVKTLYNKELTVQKNVWTYALKIKTIETAFREQGADTNRWGLTNHRGKGRKTNNFKDALNKWSHEFKPVSMDREKACEQFMAMFAILKILHDGMIKDYLRLVHNVSIKDYVMPDEAEINAMVDRYYKGIKK